MNCLKRICCLFVLFAITIALFAGCSSFVPPDTTITQPTEESTEPVTKTYFVERSSIPVIADFQDWLEEVLSQLEHPMTYFFREATDCNGFDFYFADIDSVTPSTPALRISVELDAENTYISEFELSTVGKFNQTLTHEPTETDFSLFKQLGLAAFSHFYDDSFLTDAETLLSLKPGETVYAEAFDWTHPSIRLTESDYYFSALYFDAYDNVYLSGPKDDADSYIRSLFIYPPVQANNASAKEIEDAANLVLAQAGIPAKFVFWGHDNDTFHEELNFYYYNYSLEYTGNGNDVYSDYLYGSLDYDLDEAAFTQFYINMRNIPTSETVDAMRNIFTAFAPVVSNDITDDFMTEFFALEAYRHETDSVYNRYGAEVEPLAENSSNERSPICIRYEANNEPNCIEMFFFSDSENPEKNRGHIRVFENEDANKGTKTLPFYAFAERYPVYSELYSNYGDLITYEISDQATDDLPFSLRITLRLEDLAVESIRVSYNISEADDEETIAAIYERFQKSQR